jgi:hypothetical protein
MAAWALLASSPATFSQKLIADETEKWEIPFSQKIKTVENAGSYPIPA